MLCVRKLYRLMQRNGLIHKLNAAGETYVSYFPFAGLPCSIRQHCPRLPGVSELLRSRLPSLSEIDMLDAIVP